MSKQKVCPSCTDQTGGRPTPHTVRDGKWRCGLCGHETPKRTRVTKKSRDMEDLIKKLTSEEAPTMAASTGKVAGIGVGPQGEPGVKKTKYKKDNIIMTDMLKRKVKSFKDYTRGV